MNVTVLIATHNRAPLLAQTLAAIQAQDYRGGHLEILVVDNGSTDETAAIIKEAARRGKVPVRYLHEPRAGKSCALNAALDHAHGDLFALTDDDVLPAPAWITALCGAMSETAADYVAGRILALWETAPPSWMSPALYGVLSVRDGGTVRLPLGKGINEQIMPIGANMAIRRAVVDRIGGWNPSLGKLHGTLRSGEDHEFALRMVAAGFRGVYDPDAWVLHRVPIERLTLEYCRRWFYDNGVIVAGLEQEFPTTDRYLMNVPRYLWRRAVHDVAIAAQAVVRRRDARSATAARMRLCWFAGYLRVRRELRRSRPSGSSTAASDRIRT